MFHYTALKMAAKNTVKTHYNQPVQLAIHEAELGTLKVPVT